MKRNLRMRWWYVPLAAVGTGAAVFFGSRAAQAARIRRAAADRPIVGPLRPPPPPPDAEPPGPAARRIQDYLDGLSDIQITGLRLALPEHWWGFIEAAVVMPDDEMVPIVFGPVGIDYQIMTDEQRDQLGDDIIDAVGYLNALELRNILVEVGVIT